MKKKIITGLMVLASMIGSTSFAQDIYTVSYTHLRAHET